MPSERLPDKLESWKEIATFIGRDVRTAIRWAKHQGMPVHRIPGAKRSRIHASRTEITEWLQGQSDEQSASAPRYSALSSDDYLHPNERQTVVVAERLTGTASGKSSTGRRFLALGLIVVSTIVVVGAVVISLAFYRRLSPPTKVVFRGEIVRVLDASDHELWKHKYPGSIDPQVAGKLDELVRIVDFFGDGHSEVIVVAPYRLGPNPEDPFHVEIDCYSDEGRLLWSYVPDEKFKFGTHEIDGPWMVNDVFVSGDHRNPRIWVSVFQTQWGNSFVAELDPRTGRATLRFVSTGITHRLNEVAVGNKRYLLVGGFNNEHDSGMLAVVDEQEPFAVSPQMKGTRHYCDSCPTGAPDYYLVFPRSEINRVEAVYEDQVQQINVRGTQIQATKWELHRNDGVTMIYLMRASEAGIEPVSLRYDSGYDMLHRDLAAKGKLGHSLDECPERLHPQPVRMWTPASGWSLTTFPAARASE